MTGNEREVSFRIPYPKTDKVRKAWNRDFGMNAIYAGKHWAERRKDAQMWHMLTRSAINAAKIRKVPFDRPVVISFCWNDRLDLSNHAYMAKMIEDAIKGTLIKDDSRKYVVGMEHYFHNADCIKVIIREVEMDG